MMTMRKRGSYVCAGQGQEQAPRGQGPREEAVGKATNDRSLEAEGKGDKAAGNLKQAGEKVKDAIRK